MMFKMLAAMCGTVLLSGCATAAFDAPLWPCKVSSSGDGQGKGGGGSQKPGSACVFDPAASDREANTVAAFLRANVAKYDQLIADAETGKVVTELPIIGAAVGGGTALALGSGTKVGIVAAGIGAAGTSTSAWIKPRDRLTYIVQAREATVCVLREHTHLATRASASGLATYDSAKSREIASLPLALSYPAASSQVETAGMLALSASDEIVSKLKVRLAGIGTAPDYAAILADFRRLQEQSNQAAGSDGIIQKAAGGKSINPSDLTYILEYPVRLQTCATKIQ